MSRSCPLIASLLTAAALAVPVSGASAATVTAPDGLRAIPHRTTAPARARAADAGAQDPRAADQWALQGDVPMGAESAWRQTTGGDIVVAVVDSGIDLTHPDLAPNLWTNPGEIPGNGIDDDHNGYVDDVHGYDFVDVNGTPQDANGHGTHVAGIIAARGGNGIGGSGVAWRAQLMAVRVLDAGARGNTSTVAEGIRYAVDNGARIVNLSLAGPSSASDLEDAITYAEQHGVLVVAAAGNDGRDLAASPSFPASYAEPNVIGVAATGEDGALSAISDFGAGADLAAPGVDILSTALGGGYEWRTGTSMAAPHVSGTLALLAAARPDLDWQGLRDALLSGARPTGLPVETGSLDAAAALQAVVSAAAWQPAAVAAPATHAAPTTAKAAKAAAAERRANTHRAATAKRARKARRHTRRPRASVRERQVAAHVRALR